MSKPISTGAAIAWGLVIIAFTLQEGSASGALSGSLTNTLYGWFRVIPGFTSVVTLEVFHTLIRAFAHVFNYAVFGLLVSHAVTHYRPLNARVMAGLIIFGAGYGFLDETIQRFVPGRAFTWLDILLDTLGFTLGSLAIFFYNHWFKLPKKRDV